MTTMTMIESALLLTIHIVRIDGVTQSDIRIELGLNRLFQDVIKRIKSGNWKQCSEAEKGSEQQNDALTIHNGIIRVVPFISPKLRHAWMTKAHETHPVKNATETAIRMIAWWPGISQDVLRYVSKCKECQENRPSLGKQYLLGQTLKFGKESIRTGVTLTTKVISK